MFHHGKLAPESALFFNLTPMRPAVDQSSAQDIALFTSTRTALLQALSCAEGSAQDLTQRIAECTYGQMNLPSDEVHWALRQLEREGKVESHRPELASRTHFTPRVYRITPQGLAIAAAERRAAWGLFGLSPLASASSAG